MKTSRVLILIAAFIICGGGAFSFLLRDLETIPTPLPPAPSSTTAKVVFKSRQTDGIPIEKEEPTPQQRTVASQEERFLNSKRSPKPYAGKESKIKLNDSDYTWLRSLIAKPTQSSESDVDGPGGFEIETTANPPKDFGVFDEKALLVVKDATGLDKRVITGAFIVTLTNANDVEKLAQATQLRVTSHIAHLGVAILQAQNGQNIFQKEAQIKAFPGVTKVRVEMLGRGVSAK